MISSYIAFYTNACLSTFDRTLVRAAVSLGAPITGGSPQTRRNPHLVTR